MIRNTSLYLQVGDQVYHKHYLRWGIGTVVEERSSQLPGGFCYVRINFQDGTMRVFDNNYKSECCCYYAGIVKMDAEERQPYKVSDTEQTTKRKKTKALPRG